MKIRALTFALTLLAGVLHAQADKYIKEKQVSKIIHTLSADDMRGRFCLNTEDIDKAASFIEREFRRARLEPLPGQKNFRQEFLKKRIKLKEIQVVLDGNPIEDSKLILVSTRTEIEMNTGVMVDTIGQAQNLFTTISQIEKRGGNKVVLVAREHEESFKIAKEYLAIPKIMDPDDTAESTTVYILNQARPNSISIKASQEADMIKLTNIVGMIPGKSKPGDNVIFSAHYDHIGIQKPINGDSIANGADDDASGTTAVIALAKYFSKLGTNARTLIFAAFTAEEIGGYGSKHFSQQLDPDKVVAMFNIEMIGKASKWGPNAAFITGFERSDFGEILQENLEGTAFSIHPDPYPEQNLFYRSDNATLARLGVPAHSISTDQIPTDPYYHTVNDEVETLDMANITATIKGIALSARSIVEGLDTPTRIDKATVK